MSEATPEDSVETPDNGEESEPFEDRWEWWSYAAVVCLALMVLSWAIVWARLGQVSVYVHAYAVPTLSVVTLPIVFFGLLRTIFRPPSIRRSRTIAFFAAVATGLLGSRDMIEVPLSTDDWRSDAPYSVPFEGEAVTLAGGPSLETNPNASHAATRWAYDFAFVDSDGARTELDGTRNEDHLCWGKNVLAPVDATVLEVAFDVEDNEPGSLNHDAPMGNFVLLKVGDDEFVYLTNLRSQTVDVRPGDSVRRGQVLGQCGNSGWSLMPRIHLRAQRTRDLPSEGLPIVFECATIDGEVVRDAMPNGAVEDAPFGERVSACPDPEPT